FLRAEIEALTQDAMALPTDAVVQFEGENFIFVESGKATYELVEVETGQGDSGFVAVTLPAGMESGGKVVVKGAYGLLTKLKNAEEE
ncbi:MAG TPA: efflux transporter periplasmic adaptor subunit, partial [Bacteroidia bacterium]|nr:efflux transporter periplasmic adaptor subunit [Bacteroidia bacterium]